VKILRFFQQRVILVTVITAVYSVVSVLMIVILPNVMFEDRIDGFRTEIKYLAENHLNDPVIDDDFNLFVHRDGISTLETNVGFIANINEALEDHLIMWSEMQETPTEFYSDFFDDEEFIYYIVVIEEGYYVVTYYNIAEVHSFVESFKQLSGAVLVVIYLATIVVLSIFVNSKFILNIAYFDPSTKLKTKYALYAKFVKKKLAVNELTFIAIKNWEDIVESCGVNQSDSLKSSVGKALESIFIKESIYQISESTFLIVSDHEMDNSNLEQMFNDSFKGDSIMHSYSFKIVALTVEEELVMALSPEAIIKRFDYAYGVVRGSNVKTYKIGKKLLKEINDSFYYSSNLQNALSDGLITNYYQMKVNPRTGKIVGCEALSRWIEGDNVIAPINYIGVAETSGYIYDIDLLSLRNSCRLIRKMMQEKLITKTFKVSTNFSPLTLNNVSIKTIKDILKKYDVLPEMISIEITESVMIDIEAVSKILKQIINFGISIEIDDFTAGNSSFSILPILNASVVKIDSSVLPDLDSESEKMIYKSLVNLSKNLNLKVTSEGVETLELIEYLQKLKIDNIQGYYYGKPENWRTFINHYRERNGRELI